ncbi:inner nuclear membrane protein enriched at telomere/subtelomere region [Scheffersomyces spartinae]|uniref:Inner nuclear membrane protein enriched at telomere/subtelomere region n=1 Tax=Scheffersomyces spartinae TaxID=45513 RepID=A0A9P8AGU0_9ASCO|nr:inner nuclear membrane protein enriched at telomere/subtelomere region [Scheffersomyces spartinae]KAG7192685.1 inner nuclear membrane protein enriched at telomere/subtelomere region [Scheffersomyces spartinae]
MAILENKHIIFLVMFFILLYKITEWQYYKNKRHQLQLEIIYKEVMNKLQRQKKISELNHSIPGYIGSIQLRDLILSEESNLSRKLKLWKKVSKKVEMNTNVKSTLLESHGEIMLVWEWITNL